MRAKIPTGHPSMIVPTLMREVSKIVNQSRVKMFYIGRGVDPYSRMKFHGSDMAYVIYRTTSIKNAIVVEGRLINCFYDHPKCDNDAYHGGGGISFVPESYVYVAVWL